MCPNCDETNIAQETRNVLPINHKSLRHSRKGKKMNDVFEAQSLFKEAFPLRRYESVKDMINAAYRWMSPRVSKDITHRRLETIWQAKARRIDGEEKDALRRAVIEEQRREQKELRARLASLDARLSAVDAGVDR